MQLSKIIIIMIIKKWKQQGLATFGHDMNVLILLQLQILCFYVKEV